MVYCIADAEPRDKLGRNHDNRYSEPFESTMISLRAVDHLVTPAGGFKENDAAQRICKNTTQIDAI
eukprot:758563-Hanusia_phi.AAC.3